MNHGREMKDHLVDHIVRKIVESVHPQKVILFGSRVRSDAVADSDIDLLVIYDGVLSKHEVKSNIHSLFPSHPFDLDVFVLSSKEMEFMRPIANTLAREVAETGIVYYG